MDPSVNPRRVAVVPGTYSRAVWCGTAFTRAGTPAALRYLLLVHEREPTPPATETLPVFETDTAGGWFVRVLDLVTGRLIGAAEARSSSEQRR